MTTSLDEHFEEVLDEDSYQFVLSIVEPSSDLDELTTALAELLSRNKMDPQVLTDLVEAAGWEAVASSFQGGRVEVRRGDFGEMLAAEAAEAFNEIAVPIRKLRYQIDPSQTLPGSDVVGFLLADDGTIIDLEFIESKFRAQPELDVAVDAHDQLAEDRLDGYATTIRFLASRLREVDEVLYEAFTGFLAERDTRDSANTVALTLEEENWDERIAQRLDALPDHLPDLWLRVFPLEDACDLIDDVYNELGWEAIDDE